VPQAPPQGLNLQQNFRNQWDHVDPAIMNQVGVGGAGGVAWVVGRGGAEGAGMGVLFSATMCPMPHHVNALCTAPPLATIVPSSILHTLTPSRLLRSPS
jgi:hypothetical protein